MKHKIDDKGKTQYPCSWLYKLIGADRDVVKKALNDVIGLKSAEVDMKFSNMSKKGKYLAFNVEIIVLDEKQRDEIYKGLKQHPDIKAVL